jgi:hypothetical protein
MKFGLCGSTSRRKMKGHGRRQTVIKKLVNGA